MKAGMAGDLRLEEEMLALYQRCRRECCPRAAEHVMQALEALAGERPETREALDRAYLEGGVTALLPT